MRYLLLCAMTVHAGSEPVSNESIFQSWWSDMRTTWNVGRWELIVPINTWHNRRMYDAHKIDEYNERPWGLGLSKYRYDDKGNRQFWAALSFQDSHNDPEPVIGYGWQKLWRPCDDDFRISLGFIAGITMRSDYNWIPIPAALPVLGVDISRFSIESTYIPGGKNNGNVLFTWIRWRF